MQGCRLQARTNLPLEYRSLKQQLHFEVAEEVWQEERVDYFGTQDAYYIDLVELPCGLELMAVEVGYSPVDVPMLAAPIRSEHC